ncbi:MAG: Uma2 family endonuclease [Blastocatellia bacterium]
MATNRKDMPQHYFTLEEYFALEEASEARWEYWDGELVCMSGGSRKHIIISSNVFFRLQLQLGDGPCRAFTADLPVKTPTLPPYRYPDATVACGELQFERIQSVDALLNPLLIVEVLSPSTASRDFEDKFTAYKALPTFSEYLLVAQDEPRITHYVRQADGTWTREDVAGLDASLTLACVAGMLSLRDIYRDVTFD